MSKYEVEKLKCLSNSDTFENKWIEPTENDKNRLSSKDYIMLNKYTVLLTKMNPQVIFKGEGRTLGDIFPCGLADPTHIEYVHNCERLSTSEVRVWGIFRFHIPSVITCFFVGLNNYEIYLSKILSPAYNICCNVKEYIDTNDKEKIEITSEWLAFIMYAAALSYFDMFPTISYKPNVFSLEVQKYTRAKELMKMVGDYVNKRKKTKKVSLGTQFESHHVRRNTTSLFVDNSNYQQMNYQQPPDYQQMNYPQPIDYQQMNYQQPPDYQLMYYNQSMM